MAKTPAKPPAQRTGTTSAKPSNGDREITISGPFRTVFFTTTGLTLVFVALAVILTLLRFQRYRPSGHYRGLLVERPGVAWHAGEKM
jgi:hypothetical protein